MKDFQTSKGTIYIRKMDFKNPEKNDIRREIEKVLEEKLEISNLKIGNNAIGKPFISGHPIEISISHTADTFAVYISKKEPVGIDIEPDNKMILKAKSRFMNSDELKFFPEPSLRELHLIWGAKEAVYKQFGGTFTALENEVTIQKIDNELSFIYAESIHGKTKCFFAIIDDLYVVWT